MWYRSRHPEMANQLQIQGRNAGRPLHPRPYQVLFPEGNIEGGYVLTGK